MSTTKKVEGPYKVEKFDKMKGRDYWRVTGPGLDEDAFLMGNLDATSLCNRMNIAFEQGVIFSKEREEVYTESEVKARNAELEQQVATLRAMVQEGQKMRKRAWEIFNDILKNGFPDVPVVQSFCEAMTEYDARCKSELNITPNEK